MNLFSSLIFIDGLLYKLDCSNILYFSISEFSELALGILKNCDSSDKEATRELLFKPVYDRSDLTCWTLATSSNFQEFMEQPVCQSIVMERWCGEIQLQGPYLSYWVILKMIKNHVCLMRIFFLRKDAAMNSCTLGSKQGHFYLNFTMWILKAPLSTFPLSLLPGIWCCCLLSADLQITL